MSQATDFFGGSANLPYGTVIEISGQIPNDSDFILADGSFIEYSTYPDVQTYGFEMPHPYFQVVGNISSQFDQALSTNSPAIYSFDWDDTNGNFILSIMDPSDGSNMIFFTSPDGTTWTQTATVTHPHVDDGWISNVKTIVTVSAFYAVPVFGTHSSVYWYSTDGGATFTTFDGGANGISSSNGDDLLDIITDDGTNFYIQCIGSVNSEYLYHTTDPQTGPWSVIFDSSNTIAIPISPISGIKSSIEAHSVTKTLIFFNENNEIVRSTDNGATYNVVENVRNSFGITYNSSTNGEVNYKLVSVFEWPYTASNSFGARFTVDSQSRHPFAPNIVIRSDDDGLTWYIAHEDFRRIKSAIHNESIVGNNSFIASSMLIQDSEIITMPDLAPPLLISTSRFAFSPQPSFITFIPTNGVFYGLREDSTESYETYLMKMTERDLTLGTYLPWVESYNPKSNRGSSSNPTSIDQLEATFHAIKITK